MFCPWPPPELNAEHLAGGISVASWDVQIKAIREELDIITFGSAFITLWDTLLVVYLPNFDFSDLWIKSRLNYQSWKAAVIKTLHQTLWTLQFYIKSFQWSDLVAHKSIRSRSLNLCTVSFEVWDCFQKENICIQKMKCCVIPDLEWLHQQAEGVRMGRGFLIHSIMFFFFFKAATWIC